MTELRRQNIIKFIEFNYIASSGRWIATIPLVSGRSPLKPLFKVGTSLRTILIVPHGEDGYFGDFLLLFSYFGFMVSLRAYV